MLSANAYDAVKMIDYCRKQDKKIDKVRECLDGLKNFEGASGKITVNADGEISKPFVLKSAINGKFVRIA